MHLSHVHEQKAAETRRRGGPRRIAATEQSGTRQKLCSMQTEKIRTTNCSSAYFHKGRKIGQPPHVPPRAHFSSLPEIMPNTVVHLGWTKGMPISKTVLAACWLTHVSRRLSKTGGGTCMLHALSYLCAAVAPQNQHPRQQIAPPCVSTSKRLTQRTTAPPPAWSPDASIPSSSMFPSRGSSGYVPVQQAVTIAPPDRRQVPHMKHNTMGYRRAPTKKGGTPRPPVPLPVAVYGLEYPGIVKTTNISEISLRRLHPAPPLLTQRWEDEYDSDEEDQGLSQCSTASDVSHG